MENEKLSYSIPLFYAKEQEGLRLLELPPEILAAIESSSAPSLSIKSASPPDSSSSRSTADHSEAYHAVICTSNQTYQLRQVQTSNSIFLIQPTIEAQSTSGNGLCAFATCSSTLETSGIQNLDPIKHRNAVEWLEEILPTYKLDTVNRNHSLRENAKSKEDVFAGIPYSPVECQNAWMQLVAFESSNGGALRPLAKTALEVWKSMFTIHEANSDLRTSEQVELMRDQPAQELGCEQGLVDAMLSRVLVSPQTEGKVPFDRSNTIELVGSLLLESSSSAEVDEHPLENENEHETEAGFEERLAHWVPETWRSHISTECVAQLKSNHEERQKRRAARAQATAEATGFSSAASTGASRALPPGKRNWHERLKRNKK